MSRFARKPVESSRAFGAVSESLRLFDLANEKHYSVAELAALWALSERTIRRMFENEPGVLCWGSSERRFRRGYRTLRIPETVVLRVHRQLRIAS
jgi:transcriptional regulator GlxA family with amidase domain